MSNLEKAEGYELYQGQPIKGFVIVGGAEYSVGSMLTTEPWTVESIEVVLVAGQMSSLPWFKVTFKNGRESIVNAAHCEIVWLA